MISLWWAVVQRTSTIKRQCDYVGNQGMDGLPDGWNVVPFDCTDLSLIETEGGAGVVHSKTFKGTRFNLQEQHQSHAQCPQPSLRGVPKRLQRSK
jgi:hypothetical protein